MFIDCLKQNGAEIFIIGGTVRNLIYNKYHGTNFKSKDLDFVVRLIDIDQLCALLGNFGTVKEVGKKFGVIKFRPTSSDDEYDISLPREEISIGSGHKDFTVKSDHRIELAQDCSRRDATINAIAMEIITDADLNNLNDLPDDRLYDYYGGVNDIKKKLWRAIGNPDERFTEDSLRILRAIRQSAELDLDIEEKTSDSIKKNYELIKHIKKESPVRIANELVRLISAKKSYAMIKYLFDTKLSTICDLTIDMSHFFVDLKEVDLKIRMALFLSAHNNKNVVDWTKIYQLSAAPNYNCKYVDFIDCCNNYYVNIKKIIDKYDMRKLIQLVEDKYKNKGIDYSMCLIKYYIIIEHITDDKLMILFEENKNIPLTINNVAIDGNTLMSMGFYGKNIKDTKTEILNLITIDKLENTREAILIYLKNKPM